MFARSQDTAGVQVLDGVSTASFCVVLNGDGDTHCLIGDTAANDHITVEWVSRHERSQSLGTRVDFVGFTV